MSENSEDDNTAKLDEFKILVKRFVALDNEISESNTALKELKLIKQQLQQEILGYMRDNNIGTCNVGSGNITRKIKTSRSLTKDHIKNCIKAKFTCEDNIAEECIDYIYEKRPMSEKENLEHIKKKQKSENTK